MGQMKSKIFSAIFLIGMCYCGVVNSHVHIDKSERPASRDPLMDIDKDERYHPHDVDNIPDYIDNNEKKLRINSTGI